MRMQSAINDKIADGTCVLLDEDDELIYAGPIHTAPFCDGAKVLLCSVAHAKLMAIVNRRSN
jgi:hypothetical protein